MSLLDLFNQKAKVQPPQKRGDADEQLDVYSGMRVEVTTDAGEILFVAKLLGLHGDKAELHQYSESEIAQLETNLEATATTFSGLGMGERPCKLLNISVGGASISSEHRYHEGDKFLLKVRLLEDRPESAMFAQVVRVIEKDGGRFEYGCRFIELTEPDQERITQNIFAVQRQKRKRS